MSFRSFLKKLEPGMDNLPGQKYGDYLNLFGNAPGLPAPPPPIPQAPAFSAAMNITYKPTKTNFGSFNTPLMKATLDTLHPAIPYKPPADTATPPPTTTKPPVTTAPPTTTPPPTGGGPGGPGTTEPTFVVSRPGVSPTAAFSRQYAQTPNTVVTRSSMTVPGTAVISNQPTSTAGIKPGLFAGAPAMAAAAK